MATPTTRLVRVGAVSYLNSKPLVEGLAELAPAAEIVLDYPSRLADDLADGLLDVALVPSIECLRHPDYEIVSDACVATHGPVLSVKLYSRVPPSEIRRLALDDGSRTSAVLARLLLAERHAIEPELEPLPLGRPIEATDADAVLMIGDRAIHPPQEAFYTTWDLGEEWFKWTGLPFVFALWAARSGSELGEVATALGKARDLGRERVAQIAQREAPLLGIPEQTAFDYFTKHLQFRLGPAERRGLQLFFELAAKRHLVPEGGDLVYRDCLTTG